MNTSAAIRKVKKHERDVFLNLLRLIPAHQLGNKEMIEYTPCKPSDYTIDERGHSAASTQPDLFISCPCFDQVEWRI